MYCIVTVMRFVIILIKFYVCMYCSCTEIDITMYPNCTAKITCTEIDLICTEIVMYRYCPPVCTEIDMYRK